MLLVWLEYDGDVGIDSVDQGLVFVDKKQDLGSKSLSLFDKVLEVSEVLGICKRVFEDIFQRVFDERFEHFVHQRL